MNRLKEKKCCVVIPTHKEELQGDDEKSFIQALNVFGETRDIKLIVPDNIPTEYYNHLEERHLFEIIKVNSLWLSSYDMYNKTLCSIDFYGLFKDYEYILIYQTDCWVFDDRLDYFVNLGYDYYGAPWPFYGNKVGNGGFSLRKVSKMMDIVKKYPYIEGHEDGYFCLTHRNELNICPLNVACQFSLETMHVGYEDFSENGPMGLHGNAMKHKWGKNYIKN